MAPSPDPKNDSKTTNNDHDSHDENDNEDLLAALEEEDDQDADYRANRIKQLQSELSSNTHNHHHHHNDHNSNNHHDTTITASAKQTTIQNTPDNNLHNKTSLDAPPPPTTNEPEGVISTLLNNSIYPTLPNDQSVLDLTTQIPRCLIHFFHPDFARCATMDKHLSAIAEARAHKGGGQSDATRFARVDARNVPFIAEKLKVKVLPCVIGFVDGGVVEKIVGFEGLSLGGEFKTRVLERRLGRCGILPRRAGEESESESESGEDEDEEAEAGDRRGGGVGFGVRKTIWSGNRRFDKKRGGDDDEDGDDWD